MNINERLDELERKLNNLEKMCCQCECHKRGKKEYIHQTDGFTTYGHPIPCCNCKE
jgi:hypothetical protein